MDSLLAQAGDDENLTPHSRRHQNAPMSDSQAPLGGAPSRQHTIQNRRTDVRQLPPQRQRWSQDHEHASQAAHDTAEQIDHVEIARHDTDMPRALHQSPQVQELTRYFQERYEIFPGGSLTRRSRHVTGLDVGSRPAPATDEEMTVKLECAICLQQRADITCLPCGHTVMCRWCADMHMPLREENGLMPEGHAKCPTCRERVRNRAS